MSRSFTFLLWISRKWWRGKHYDGFRSAYLESILTSSKGQLYHRNGVSPNIVAFLFVWSSFIFYNFSFSFLTWFVPFFLSFLSSLFFYFILFIYLIYKTDTIYTIPSILSAYKGCENVFRFTLCYLLHVVFKCVIINYIKKSTKAIYNE